MQSMEYHNVCLEGMGFVLPREIVTSSEIETRLHPVYERLRLPPGRLELMTGIRQRRFWKPGARPSTLSIRSCQLALAAANMPPEKIGCLVHGSVCRDFLEPATASAVHHGAELAPECLLYDVSNACLGILNGVLQAANMIELGQIEAALVVGSEGGRPLVEATIDFLNSHSSLTRQSIKPAFASLTIGSASCAILLAHRQISATGCRLHCATALANTQFHHLCQSDQDQAGSAMSPLMDTDSEELLKQGINTGDRSFQKFLEQSSWRRDRIDATVCHQVGVAHQRLIREQLQLDPDKDRVTYPWLGNTGSAALPVTLAHAAQQNEFRPGDRIALLGIGSGINCIAIGLEWAPVKVASEACNG